MKTKANNHQAGFTLIEFIVTLVIAAIAGSMVYAFMGNMLTKSSDPIVRLQKTSNLHQVMENIVADYNRLNKLNLRYKWRSGAAYSVGDVVLPSSGIDNATSSINNNGRYYRCNSAHTSNASNLPIWTVTITSPLTGTGTDGGTVRWIEAGRVWQPSVAYIVGTIVTPIYNNGHFYRCTTAGSNTGTLTPGDLSWPVNSGAVTIAAGAVWQEVGTILDTTTSTDNMSNYLTTTPVRYGASTVYNVVTAETKFIKFSGTNEANAASTDEKNILKVTIKSYDSAETLTQLFTIR
jgi:prepilin-type N-terminal cleavage/methylation domain-containing protein